VYSPSEGYYCINASNALRYVSDVSSKPANWSTVSVSGIAAGWTLSKGTVNADGSWTVVTNDSSLTVTTPNTSPGALVLNVADTWANADGSMTTTVDNVEAYVILAQTPRE
jgi:hypothetical protein